MNLDTKPPEMEFTKLSIDDIPTESAPKFPKDGLRSHLTTHTFESPLANIRFYSYYNETTPIYYELRPFVVALKTVSEEATIKTIPSDWLRKASNFDDPKFEKAKIDPNSEFAEGLAIQYLVLNSDNKQRKQFVEKLYRICFHQIETDRTIRMHKHLKDLMHQIHELKKKHEQHSTAMDIFHDLLRILSDKHDDIGKLIRSIIKK